MHEKGPVVSMNETQGPESQDAGAIATLDQRASLLYFQQGPMECWGRGREVRGHVKRVPVHQDRVIGFLFNSDKTPRQNQALSF